MAISRLVDDRSYTPQPKSTKMKPRSAISCQKGIADCMFNVNGDCSAEWCIFAELPDIVVGSKSISCSVCGNTTTVSIYSGSSNYICPDCQSKIKQCIENPTCAICGATVSPGVGLCGSCAERIRGKLDE